MRYGLQVGFGNLIGGELLESLRVRGVQLVRSDYQGVRAADQIPALIGEVHNAGLVPLSTMRPDQVSWLPPVEAFGPLDVEIWNEPDLGTAPSPKLSPDAYAAAVRSAHEGLSGPHRLWCGVISNLDKDSLLWLEASIRRGWPEDIGVSVHRYPPNGGRPEQGHKGFSSRADEVARLKRIIGGRPWGVSEFGYHLGEQSSGWWIWKRRWHWTPQQQKEFTAWDFRFWAGQDADFAVNYQINSGGGTGYLDRFGWRDKDSAWLPVADVLAEVNV